MSQLTTLVDGQIEVVTKNVVVAGVTVVLYQCNSCSVYVMKDHVQLWKDHPIKFYDVHQDVLVESKESPCYLCAECNKWYSKRLDLRRRREFYASLYREYRTSEKMEYEATSIRGYMAYIPKFLESQ